jgi:alpha-mannosidase
MGGGMQRKSATPVPYPVLVDHPVGQKVHGIYRDRLAQFTAEGQYECRNLLS